MAYFSTTSASVSSCGCAVRAGSSLPNDIEGIQPTDEQVVPGREHFAVLLVTVEEMDWFHLANTGHRRAVFAKGEWNWVAP